MAEDETNETEETVPGTPDTAEVVEEAAVDETPEAEGDVTVAETSSEAEAVDAPEEAPGTAPTTPEPDPVKPARSRKHLPRSQRRTRPRPKREPAAKRGEVTR